MRLLISPTSLVAKAKNTYKVGKIRFSNIHAARAYMEESLEFIEAMGNLGSLVLVRDPEAKQISPVLRNSIVPILNKYGGLMYKSKGNEVIFTFTHSRDSIGFEKEMHRMHPRLEVRHV